MKLKLLLTLFVFTYISTIAHAEKPKKLIEGSQFGLTIASNGLAGISVLNKQFNVSLLTQQQDNVGGIDGVSQSIIELNGKYKTAIEENTYTAIGAKYSTVESKTPLGTNKNTNMALLVGIEHNLSNRLLLFADTEAFSIEDIDGGEEETGILSNSRVGVTLLF